MKRWLGIVGLVTACGELPIEGEPWQQTEARRLEFTVVDSSRSTPAVGSANEQSMRTLDVLVWLGPDPAEGASDRPVLVMAHGWGGDPAKFDAFGSALAEEGIVVAAVRFPLTHEDAPEGFVLGYGDLENQPGDLSAVVSWLVAESGRPGSPLFERYDPWNQLALLGHSLGGATALGLTRYDCCLDVRPSALVVIAPTVMSAELAFGAGSMRPDGPPTLMIHGLDDPVVNPSESDSLWDVIEGPKAYVGLVGVGHVSMLESDVPVPPEQMFTQRAVESWLLEQMRGEALAMDEVLDDLVLDGHQVLDAR